jgi:hypothetical protein
MYGWLTFDAATVSNVATPMSFPNAGVPNAVLAGYWGNHMGYVCTRYDADRTIIEWLAYHLGPNRFVQVSVSVYKAGNRIEWAFGPLNATDGTSATVGVENSTGTVGFPVAGGAGTIAPGFTEALVLP